MRLREAQEGKGWNRLARRRAVLVHLPIASYRGDFIRPLLKSLVAPQAFTDPGFVQHSLLRWLQIQGPTWSWYAQLVRETVQEATGMTLEPATHGERRSARPNSPTDTGVSEPNDMRYPRRTGNRSDSCPMTNRNERARDCCPEFPKGGETWSGERRSH